MSVEGDLRFLSHHDMMRAVERTAGRAKLPLRMSQGFNPRPAMSLACPRPVGVATRDDLLVITLAVPMAAQEVLDSLNASAPLGLRFVRAEVLAGRRSLHPREISYELALDESQRPAVELRLGELASQEQWIVQRRRKEEGLPQDLDIRPLVASASVSDGTLRWTLMPLDQTWARPSEVLALLGLDAQVDLARTVRTAVKYG